MLPDLAWVRSLTAGQLPAASLQLASLQCAIAARLTSEASDKPAPSADLVDAPTLAAKLNLKESWIRSRARSGKLPHIMCGRYVRFKIADVAAALEAKP